MRDRWLIKNRDPPSRSACGSCTQVFEGKDCWVRRADHVTRCDKYRPGARTEDAELKAWALREGVVGASADGAIQLRRGRQPPNIRPPPLSSQDNGSESPRLGRRTIGAKASPTPVTMGGHPSAATRETECDERVSPPKMGFRQFVWVCVSDRPSCPSHYPTVVIPVELTGPKDLQPEI